MSKSSSARGDAEWMWQTYADLLGHRGAALDDTIGDPLSWLASQLDLVSQPHRTAQFLLHHAFAAGDWDAAALLQARGATVDGSLLADAIGRRDASALDRLLKAGGDPGAIGDSGPLLFDAILGSDASLVEILLDAGASLERPVGMGTPLMWAAFHGIVPMVDLLLARGADPTAFHDGDSPASLARQRGHEELAARLDRLCRA